MSHLITIEEAEALMQFRLGIADILDKLDEYDSHDNNLVRWLRARDLDTAMAEKMIRESMKWREGNQIDELQRLPFPETFLKDLAFTPCGHDKQGTVICIVPIGTWQLRKLTQGGSSHQVLIYVAQIFERYFSYAKKTNTVENMKAQIVLIFDCDQFSLQEIMSKQVVDTVIQMLKIYEANYPERLKYAYFVNIPKVFEILWAILKPVLPTRTLSKIHLLGGCSERWKKILLQNIDSRELPSWYGGSNTAHPLYENRLGESWPPRAAEFSPEDFVTAVIPPKQTLVKSFALSAGNCISWNFSTDAYDIGFEFQLDSKRMFPYAKADSHLHVQDGCVDVIEAGKYSLVFDNTYSKYRSKTLRFAIRVGNTIVEKAN